VKFTNLYKKEANERKEKIAEHEKILKVKDIEYDKQLARGLKMDNLPTKYAQTSQELNTMQDKYVESETKIEELQMKLMQKTQEVLILIFIKILN
jgi:hypothetical protein